MQGIKSIYNLIELTRKYPIAENYLCSDRHSDSVSSWLRVLGAFLGDLECYHVFFDFHRTMFPETGQLEAR
jgi:hypothetical protein